MTMRALVGSWLGALAATFLAVLPAQAAPSAFSDWTAVVIAGDWRAHDGGPSEAFDNARRDVAGALEAAGFSHVNVTQFSVRPERYKDTRPLPAEGQAIYDSLSRGAASRPGGCLFYISTHGAPQGVVVGDKLLSPKVLGSMIDDACGQRPTVVVISACFSGVFIPELAGANRMILTAARPDRTSFGCGQTDRYPYFDDCFLQVMPKVDSFATLGTGVQACVAARELAEGMTPPSEPQDWVGAGLRPMLPLYTFAPRRGP